MDAAFASSDSLSAKLFFGGKFSRHAGRSLLRRMEVDLKRPSTSARNFNQNFNRYHYRKIARIGNVFTLLSVAYVNRRNEHVFLAPSAIR
jgi:hypothetical protein